MITSVSPALSSAEGYFLRLLVAFYKKCGYEKKENEMVSTHRPWHCVQLLMEYV